MELPAAASLQMSKALAQLTLDLQAYRNISAEEAATTLEGALAGRMRGMVQLGIVIKEADIQETALRLGLVRTGQTMSEQQATLARFITVQEKLSKVNGEFARNLDKPAVMLIQLRQRMGDAVESMGTALMPGMIKVMGLALGLTNRLKNLVAAFASLPASVRVGTVAIAGIAAAIGPGLWALGSLLLILPKVKRAFMLAFTPLGGTLLMVTTALVALYVWTKKIADLTGEMTARHQARAGRIRTLWEDAVRRATPPGRPAPAALTEAQQMAAAIAEANRLAELERRRLEAAAKMASLTHGILKDTKDIAAAMDVKLGGFKSIAASVKAAGAALKAMEPYVSSWARYMDEQAALVESRFAEMARNITDSLTNLFSDVLMGQADAFGRFLNTIERMIADFVARQAIQRIGEAIAINLLGSYAPLGNRTAGTPAMSLVGARVGGGETVHFHVNTTFAPSFIDARSGAAWLRENEGVITEAVISGVRKSGAARAAIVGR
jgi:hypothetical protein